MRKWILLAIMVALLPFAVNSWALPDNVTATEYSGSQTIKTSQACVYSVNVSAVGVTAGDKVQLVDGGTSGTVRFSCIASSTTTTGTLSCGTSSVSYLFNTNLYLKETKAGGGTFFTDIQLF